MEIYVSKDIELNPYCFNCFKWFISEISTNAADENQVSLNEVYGEDSRSLTFYNVKSGTFGEYDIIQSYIVISSIRTDHAGYCIDDNLIANHPLIPGNNYNIELQINSQDNDDIIFQSDPISISTSKAPHDGYCNVYDLDNLLILTPFSLECYDWIESEESSGNFTFNALFADVLMMEQFQISPQLVMGLVGVGEFEIVALIKSNLQSIGCYEMNIKFPNIDHVFNTTNITVTFLNEQIALIMAITDLGENNDIAIAIYSVINGLYITQRNDRKTAAKVVEELIYNILNSSPLLRSLNESTFNLTAEVILSELSTIAKITSCSKYVD